MLRCNWDPREQAFCLRFALLSSHISPHVLTGSSNVRIDFLVHANKVKFREDFKRGVIDRRKIGIEISQKARLK